MATASKTLPSSSSDANAAFDMALRGGARAVREPTVARGRERASDEGDDRDLRRDRSHFRCNATAIAASSRPVSSRRVRAIAHAAKPGLQFIDHCVGNVGWGEMDAWGDFYGRVFGFSQLVSFDDKDISTEYTALRSKVMTDHGIA